MWLDGGGWSRRQARVFPGTKRKASLPPKSPSLTRPAHPKILQRPVSFLHTSYAKMILAPP